MAKQKVAVGKSKLGRPTAQKKRKASPFEHRAARDVSIGPSAKRIERSLQEGTKQSLAFFRSTINWQ